MSLLASAIIVGASGHGNMQVRIKRIEKERVCINSAMSRCHFHLRSFLEGLLYLLTFYHKQNTAESDKNKKSLYVPPFLLSYCLNESSGNLG